MRHELLTEAPPTDPWATAPASWLPLSGSRAEREQARHAPQKPALWREIIDPADRALIAQLAHEVLAAEPGLRFGFGGKVLARLRARGATARTAAERERLHALDVVVSRHLEDLADLRTRTLALRDREAS